MTGLVLEGGGVRGLYTAGVLDVFMEECVCFDGVIGVSAGAIHGCSYLSGQNGRSIRYYKKYLRNWRFMSLSSWVITGDYVGNEFCYHELPDVLDPYDHDAFERCGVPFYVVCSNVETGMPEYLQVTDMREQIDLIRASASLPYFSRTVNWNGQMYLDGGCTDSIPLKAFEQKGYKRNVVILTRDISYRKSPEMMAFARVAYGKYPSFVNALMRRHTMYNDSLDYVAAQERSNAAFVIRPSHPLEVSRLEKDIGRVEKAYELGRKDAKARLDALKAWQNV